MVKAPVIVLRNHKIDSSDRLDLSIPIKSSIDPYSSEELS